MHRIVQWNMRGYYGNFEDLKLMIRNSNFPSCICLQETLLADNPAYPPSKYFIYPKTQQTNSTITPRGIAVLINRKIPHKIINLNTDLEAQAVRIHLSKTYTIVNLYISPQVPASEQQINNIISQITHPFIIVGDFNARSPIWGDSTDNPQGRTIESLLMNSNVSLLNTGSPTHYHIQTNTESCIDLSLCSPESLLDFSWTATDDSLRSDHYPIYIDEITPSQSNHNERYNFQKADWSLFESLTDMPYNDLNNDIDSLVDHFNTLIIAAADSSIHKSNSIGSKYPLPWWNSECTQAVRQRKAARRRYRRTGQVQDKVELNRITALTKLTLRNARRNYTKQFISSINSETPLSKIYKKVNKISGKYRPSPLPALETPNNSIEIDPTTTSNLLCEYFSEISSNQSYSQQLINTQMNQEQIPLDFIDHAGEPYNEEITEAEFLGALRKCKESAPGQDNIPYILLKKMNSSAKVFLLRLYNKILSEEVFPASWKMSLLIPIPKPGKPPQLTSSYRPIALTSCTCKLLEKIINNRLMFTLEKCHKINPNQYGFRKNRSTIDPIIRLHTDICTSLADKSFLVAIFFDIQKAYDRTWKFLIIKALHSSGIKGKIISFIRSFLSNRLIQVKVANTLSTSLTQDQGVPQGSVLSCTLFSMAINSVLDVIPEDIKKCLYVDDLCIWYSSNYMPSIERKLQHALNKIDAWTRETGFAFSVEKTAVVRFHNKRGLQPEPSLNLNQRQLLVKTHTRYLGLILDEKLNWRRHTEDLKVKTHNALNLLKFFSRKSWGSDRATLMKLYTSIIRPMLDYGCEIYGSAKPYILKKLDAVHHTAIRIASGAYRSSPTTSLCVETGEPPLSRRRQLLTNLLYLRLHRNPAIPSAASALSSAFDYKFQNISTGIPLGTTARNNLREIVPTINIIVHLTDHEPPWHIPENVICNGISGSKVDNEFILRTKFLCHVHYRHANSTHYYTDGSRNSDGVGVGIFNRHHSISQTLPKISSIFSAEIYAIFLCITTIANRQDQRCTIFTDSKSSLDSIKDMYSENPVIKQIQSLLIRLSRSNIEIRLCWVPAHVNISGNEAADQLAKSATSSSQPPALYKSFYRDYFPKIKKSAYDDWQNYWHDLRSTIDRPNKLRRIKSSTKAWSSSCLPKQRLLERSLCRLRIGHCHLTHKFLMERGEPPECDYCQCPLTVDHVLTECALYGRIRRQVYGPNRPSLRAMLSEEDADFNLVKISQFLFDSNLIHEI